MRLQRIRVTNYKSVLDSEWFDVGGLTCLVGKNESGKTALLEALEKLNSVDQDRADFHDTDYPRLHWSEYSESDTVDDAIATEWTLDASEVARINALAGMQSVDANHKVTLSKNYENKRHWELGPPIGEVVTGLVERSGLSPEDRVPLASVTTTDQLIKTLAGLADPTERQQAFLAELKKRYPNGSLTAEVERFLDGRLPHFLYYSQYDRLPGQIAVDQLVRAKSQGTLDRFPGFKIFIALLSMVGTSPEDIQQITTSEHLIAQLGVNPKKRTTRKVNFADLAVQ